MSCTQELVSPSLLIKLTFPFDLTPSISSFCHNVQRRQRRPPPQRRSSTSQPGTRHRPRDFLHSWQLVWPPPINKTAHSWPICSRPSTSMTPPIFIKDKDLYANTSTPYNHNLLPYTNYTPPTMPLVDTPFPPLPSSSRTKIHTPTQAHHTSTTSCPTMAAQ